jgi:hypothetical protein
MMATLAPRTHGTPPIVASLFERQGTLARYGLALLVFALVAASLQLVDARMLNGVNVWVKPTKFFVSLSVFALTTAWFFGYVRPERRRSLPMRVVVATIILASTLELAWITWQASQGLDSHFYTPTPFYAVMYGLMGLFAVLLVSTTLPLAWEILRRPAEGLKPHFVAAAVIGLVLTFALGGGFGGYMSSQPGHAVGSEGSGVPLFGWNGLGGDLRVAHFMGVHAEQALPLIAWLAKDLAVPSRWAVTLGGSAIYTLLTVAVFAQAVAGRSLLSAV